MPTGIETKCPRNGLNLSMLLDSIGIDGDIAAPRIVKMLGRRSLSSLTSLFKNRAIVISASMTNRMESLASG